MQNDDRITVVILHMDSNYISKYLLRKCRHTDLRVFRGEARRFEASNQYYGRHFAYGLEFFRCFARLRYAKLR